MYVSPQQARFLRNLRKTQQAKSFCASLFSHGVLLVVTFSKSHVCTRLLFMFPHAVLWAIQCKQNSIWFVEWITSPGNASSPEVATERMVFHDKRVRPSK